MPRGCSVADEPPFFAIVRVNVLPRRALLTGLGSRRAQANASAGAPAHEFAQAQYRAPWALLSAGVDHLEQQNSLSLIENEIFATSSINDSFALVDTHGLPGARVLHENRDVGRTDAAGRLRVPDLRAFDVNYLAEDLTEIPQDATLNIVTREVLPQDRSGIVVKFPVKVSRAALLLLVDDSGVPLPAGSTVPLRMAGASFPAGYDGAVCVVELEPHNELKVEREVGGQCAVFFDYKSVQGKIPTIGPLACKEPAS